MEDHGRPFRLAEDGEPAPRTAAAPPGGSGRAAPGPPPASKRRGGPGEGPAEVDPRTVAERRGTAVAPTSGVRPPPPGWPAEALAFPLRRPGPAALAAQVLVLAVLDALRTTPLAFLALVVEVPYLALLVRWFLHEAGMSAGGLDRPAGLVRVLEMDGAAMRAFGGVLLTALLLMLPAGLAFLKGARGAGIALAVVGAAFLSVALLGAAVGDPGLRRPWRAAEWLVHRPLPFLAGALGPTAFALSEALAFRASREPLVVAVGASLAGRAAALYLWLLSARALGVAGRAWRPDGDAGGAAPTSPAG